MALNVRKGCGLMRPLCAALPGEQSSRPEPSTQPDPCQPGPGCTTLGTCPAGLRRRSPPGVPPRVNRNIGPPIRDVRHLNRRQSTTCCTWLGGKVITGEASGPDASRAQRPRLALANRLVWTPDKPGTSSLLAPTGAWVTDRATAPSGRQQSW